MPSGSNHLELDGKQVRLSNLDKVLYPDDGTTKFDVIQHYLTVADVILPQLAGRPATRKRWPDGVESKPFFEKNLPRGTPDWVRRVEIASPGSSKDRTHVTYPVIENRAGLAWVANLAALELHTPQWSVGPRDGIHDADRLVIDLDPGAPAGLPECVEVARLIRERLGDDDLDAIPVTSGSKGMQLYAPLPTSRPPMELREYAYELATSLESDHPELVVSNMKKAQRGGKILLDWSQNNPAKTTITPYSLRGRQRAWVATPRSWDELDDPESLRQVHHTEIPDRLETYGDLMTT
ncbi:non-homologous end-joining DNA ligase [Solicola gregarius]|uniref:Non-homologous end-joining DNA ligase n=1 Tax=Solicola gregarius TaxID=2908642 RepID=A0AA46TIL8_9ACTN|nr:non-homologous end-joining DNA ligase [Solicola gregarius]UYM05554.1 non-homologous end-joining DNA ligase [Solicola gregarius]